MASIRGPFVWVLILGLLPGCFTQSTSAETTTMTTDSESSTGLELTTAMEMTTTQNVSMETNPETTTMMLTEDTTEGATEAATELTTGDTSEETTTWTDAMTTTELTTMEPTTMAIPTTSLEPITLTNCTNNTDCSFDNSSCSGVNGTMGVCQCKDNYVLTGSSACTSVSLFKVTNLTLKNVTEDSIVVEWNATQNFPGVMIYYTVTFNGSVNSNVSSPYLIKNLSDGEVHSAQITSNVRGRDGREATVMSDVELTRTVPRAPEFVRNQSYAAPSATISWNPRNPDVKKFYVTLTGPGVSFSNVTNKTSITYNGLGPGRNYTVTVVQQTNKPYETNSSKASFEFHTNSTEPGPPKAIEVIKVEQRKISLNITDTDTPNGDIAGYHFKLRYQIYPDTEYMERTTFLQKTASSIYDLHYIAPGVTYMIAVFTRNNAFNSSSNFTLDNVTTLPDIPGMVSELDPQQTNQTNTSGLIRWGRPDSPNGNMKAYRVVLNGRPNIIQCRFYFLCIGMCNDTILGPPNDTCVIQNDTTLVENQREMSLLVDNLRVGTTYTLSVVGYTEAGAGNHPLHITLRTLSIVPAAVNANSFQISFSSTGATNFNLKWDAPAFPGEDLKYQVTLSDQLKDVTLDTRDTSSPAYSPSSSVRSVRIYNYYKYSIVVTPITSAGRAYGQTYSFITPSKGVLGRPQRLQIDMLPDDCKHISIAWTEANIEARNGPITQYIFENRDGTDKWTYNVPSPNYWTLTNKDFSYKLLVREQATYSLEIYAKSPNQTGVTYTTQRFQTNKCPTSNASEIVGIVFAFLILLGVCLAVIVFVYRRKVREIEEVYVNNHTGHRTSHIGTRVSTVVEEEIDLERPFILSDAQKTFEEKSADSNRLFLIEYDDIKKLSQIEGKKQTTNAANLDANKAKNRYVNILSYDHSRVKLRLIDDDPCSDYINANYIVGYTYECEYIASQGPLPGTVNDFWRMTWEQSITVIVMLTKCKEGNTDKCEHYWPDTANEPKQYGDIVVNLISVSNMDKFDINIFQVSQGDYTRTIKHFHFLEWPDFSASVDSTVVIDFIQTVRTHITPEVKGPILIHCSAGVGRTGTYISIDYLLQFVRDHDLSHKVDVFAWVVKMRKNRVSMVQVDKQYIFIHRALTELVERKRNGLLQSQDDSTITNEIVYENTAYQSDEEDEEEEEEEEEDPDEMYENSMKKLNEEQQLTEL